MHQSIKDAIERGKARRIENAKVDPDLLKRLVEEGCQEAVAIWDQQVEAARTEAREWVTTVLPAMIEEQVVEGQREVHIAGMEVADFFDLPRSHMSRTKGYLHTFDRPKGQALVDALLEAGLSLAAEEWLDSRPLSDPVTSLEDVRRYTGRYLVARWGGK